MNKQTIINAALSFCITFSISTQAKSDDNAGVPKITMTKTDLNDKALRISYEIKNTSKQDVWICASINENTGCDFEVYIDNDIKTLVVRRRIDVPSTTQWLIQPYGKYIRLRPGEIRTESVSLSLPVRFNRMYMEYQENKQIESIAHVTIEIGYYIGNLPKMFINMLEETEKTDLDTHILFDMEFGGVLGFNNWNERLIKRTEEEVLIPYTGQKFKGEEVLRAVIDDIKIPYDETIKRSEINPPEMNTCTKVEIQYQPSMLEYFFPYQSQQSLFTRQEIEYLQSQSSIVIEDKEAINEFANEVIQTKHIEGGIVSEKSKANVISYHDSRRVTSFTVYEDTSIENKQKQRIKYNSELQSLRKFTPQIQSFELRVRCASNLRNLWYRLRFYDRRKKSNAPPFYDNLKLGNVDSNMPEKTTPGDIAKIEKYLRSSLEKMKRREIEIRDNIELVYPAQQRWCDDMEWAFVGPRIRSLRHEADLKMNLHVCPSVDEGMSTYAMNPSCRYDSALDTVLLFEIKAGWNQHGGPELFTFDNHDPKGGCVLLNDGTVKFIRTKEELQQLRWN